MSTRRPASGRRIGTGFLRVDARRAIAKLREYQLSDPSVWILEAIRAAVSSGATRVDLQGDSNDIWLSWQGPIWSSESLVELLNELVSPASAQTPQLRLLATAVNSALGLDPAYIDLYRIETDKTEKVRYTPEILEAPDEPDETSILDSLAIEQVRPPARAGDATMFIHLRRRFGMEHVRNFFRGEPPEMSVARQSCVDLSIPITIGKLEFGIHCNANDLLRIPLANDLSGFLALVREPEADSNKAQIHVAENGVRITRYEIDLGGELRAPLPLRLVVDAERMPTNASRSQVRRQAHPISAATEQLPELFASLCDELARLLTATETYQESLREGALTMLAAAVAGDAWSTRILAAAKPYRKLTTLPLLRNALGDKCSLEKLMFFDAVYRERKPISRELEEWFKTVLWVPDGDPAECLLGYVDPRAFKLRMRKARRTLKARRRFLAHAPRKAKLQNLPAHWVHAPVAAPLQSSCAPPRDLEGEVCIVSGHGGTITVLLDGREIEEIEVESAIGFRAIVSTGKLVPAADYRSIERDWSLEVLIDQVHRACVRCVEVLCLGGGDAFHISAMPSETELRPLVRASLARTRALKVQAGDSELTRVNAWPKIGGGWISLQDLRQLPFVATALRASESLVPSVRTGIVCPDFAERAFLREDLEPKTAVVHYESPNRAVENLAESLVYASSGAAALRIHGKDERGAIVWNGSPRRLWMYHWGKSLQLPAGHIWDGPSIHIDNDYVIPSHDWKHVRDAGGLDHRDFADWEQQLARAFALALMNRAPSDFFNSGMDFSGPAGRCFVRAVVEAKDPVEYLGENIFQALSHAALFAVLGRGTASAAALAQQFPDTIEYLEHGPSRSIPSPGGDWQPLVATRHEATLVGCLAHREIREASGELARRLAEAGRKRRLQEHRAQAMTSDEVLLAGCPVVLRFRNELFRGSVGINAVTKAHLDLHLLIEERPFYFTQLSSPVALVAAISIEPSAVDVHFKAVPEELMGKIVRSVRARAFALLEEALRLNPLALLKPGPVRDFCKIWFQQKSRSTSKLQKVTSLARFYDQYGEPLALADALDGAFLSLARETGRPWLGPLKGEPKVPLDAPTLTIPELGSAELEAFLLQLCGDVVINDLSVQVRQLQTERQIQRGQLITPTVPGNEDFKRRLTQLSAHDGLGEIGLCEASQAEVCLWQGPSELNRFKLDLRLPVVVAIDDSDLNALAACGGLEIGFERDRLEERVSKLAMLLLASVFGSGVEVPEWLRGRLVAALCAGDLVAAEVKGLLATPVFRTTAGASCSWQDLVDQAEHFGNVWFTGEDSQLESLDTNRLVVALAPRETPASFTSELKFIDAHNELALDELARQNQTRAPVRRFALNEQQTKAAIATTGLKGKRGLNGVVAPLRPQHARMRGVLAHRKHRPLGKGSDPCSWPTLSIVDDASLEPNRTWSAPQEDKHWKALCSKIVKASDQALSCEHPIPKDAVTSHWVGRYVEALGPQYLKDGVVLRGRLWLTGSTAPGRLTIMTGDQESICSARFDESGRDFPLPVHGSLWCYGATADAMSYVSEVVDALYPRLLRQLASLKKATADCKAAHLAIGLATRNAKHRTLAMTQFPCFEPDSLDANGLLQFLIDGKANAATLVDDGSELSRAVTRLVAGTSIVAAAAPPRIVNAVESPIEDLADEVRDQLDRLKLGKMIAFVEIEAETSSPIVRVEGKRLVLAGAHDDLRQLQAEKIAGSIHYPGALRLLLCHILTVLNQRLTEVTDAAERRALLALLRSA